MKRRTVIRMSLTVALVVYLFVMVGVTGASERADVFEGVEINVSDSAGTGFLTARDVDAELGGLLSRLDTMPRGHLNTLELRDMLLSLDRVEDARVTQLNNGVLRLDVQAMSPVARVFADGGSYYVNRPGKRIRSRVGYHVDVPVVTVDSGMQLDMPALLPMLEYIKRDPGLNALVSTVHVTGGGDIVITPAIAGHTVTVGDTSAVADKFLRLKTFYRNVMPVKGWDYYSDISVKWRGRVTATRATARPVEIVDDSLAGAIDEILSDAVMTGAVTPAATTQD